MKRTYQSVAQKGLAKKKECSSDTQKLIHPETSEHVDGLATSEQESTPLFVDDNSFNNNTSEESSNQMQARMMIFLPLS